MKSEQQFQQLMLQYQQLKNGAEEIARLLEVEDFDSAITMIKLRESLFLSCKTIRRYLELTPPQQKEADKIYNEIKELERKNIETLEKGMEFVKAELNRTQTVLKLNKAYGRNNDDSQGTIINMEK